MDHRLNNHFIPIAFYHFSSSKHSFIHSSIIVQVLCIDIFSVEMSSNIDYLSILSGASSTSSGSNSSANINTATSSSSTSKHHQNTIGARLQAVTSTVSSSSATATTTDHSHSTANATTTSGTDHRSSTLFHANNTSQSQQQQIIHSMLGYRTAAAAANDRDCTFGLDGLVPVIRTGSTSDATLFSLGLDLSTLGLALTANEPLHRKFQSPWFDHRNCAENVLPACYFAAEAPGLDVHIGALSDETLFYVFYAMPRDQYQLMAASELHTRGWRYHKVLKLWFIKDSLAGQPSAANAAASNAASTPGQEHGIFIFFDFTNWQRVKKEFVIIAEQVEDKPPVLASNSN